ncbi:uncharacterized protein LOC144665220 [Oculina patagonica]
MVPGLTKWRIDQARKHAAIVGPGRPKELPEIRRTRLDPVKEDHFLYFIASPNYLQDVAYGTKFLKLSSGETIEIPNVVPTVTVTRLADLNVSFCREEQFVPLGRSTLFTMLQVCAASQKKSLAGLDNVATDGASSFNTLNDVVGKLAEAGMPQSWAKELQEKLKSSKNYLKTDYKLHIAAESRCADHCRLHALSDTGKEFQGKCLHEHDVACDRCETLESTLAEIEVAFSSDKTQLSNDQKEEISHDAEAAVKKVKDWKAHIMRTAHQEAAKTTVLDEMTSTQVFIVMDWAIKFLPVCFRETQSEWFGKKGRSWHVSAAITKTTEGEFEVRTFVHAFDQCAQDWFSVGSIIENVLTQLKTSQPGIKEAFLRSDNAGCYHCGPLMLAIPRISRRVGITIRRYDFSDPQSGKDICDRRIATMKSHMRRYLNEGNDINTASEMKRALDSYGGVKGCRAAVVGVDTSRKDISQHKWTGIQSLNNFEFHRLGVRVWKAYGIGKGKLIRNQEMKEMAKPQGKTGLIVHEEFSSPETDTGALKKATGGQCAADNEDKSESTHDVDDRPSQGGFPCPEVGCVKVFVSRKTLDKHLDVGKHFYQVHKESMYDVIKRNWVFRCTTVGTVKVTNEVSDDVDKSHGQRSSLAPEKGWALKGAKKRVRFSQPVKDFLNQIFLKGEETGQKANPKEVSSQLRTMRTPDGKKRFQRSYWLTVQQITSYFSRLSVLHRSGRILESAEDVDDEEVAMIEEALERQQMSNNISTNLDM